MGTVWGVEMEGRTVLDLGGYSGWAAALTLEAGAQKATVVDSGEWRQYDWGEPGHANGVRYVEADLLDWREPAEIVICFNVIYHVLDYQAALDHIRTLTKERLLLKTSFVHEDEVGVDGWRHYPGATGHGNHTVWARPSVRGLHQALERVGFKVVGRADDNGAPDEGIFICA